MEKIGHGRRRWGAIYASSKGEQFYLSWRKSPALYRGGEKSLSSAVRNETAAWAFDYDLLLRLKTRGVKLIGVICQDTGDKFLTELRNYFDHGIRQYHPKDRNQQVYLNLSYFRVRQARKIRL